MINFLDEFWKNFCIGGWSYPIIAIEEIPNKEFYQKKILRNSFETEHEMIFFTVRHPTSWPCRILWVLHYKTPEQPILIKCKRQLTKIKHSWLKRKNIYFIISKVYRKS